MGKPSPSLRDVAQTAGVSLGTASRAINNKSNVLPATRALVLKAAADLGYKLQIRIPTSIASKMNTIGVVVKRDPGEFPRIDPFNYTVLCGIEDECERLGINMMYASLPVNEFSHAISWSPLLENDEIDGLVIVGIIFDDPEVIKRIPANTPVVLVDAYSLALDCDTVVTDNFRGAYDAVQFLIEHGHTHIGLIGSSVIQREHPGISERRRGYLRALGDYGLATTYVEESSLHGETAYGATRALLNRAPEITAIFGCNDDVAYHIIEAVKDSNLRVPDDISVIGFDDIAVPLSSSPLLTTIRVDKEFMGSLAVRQLYDRAVHRDRPSTTTVIKTTLVTRDTVQRLVNRQQLHA